MDELIIDMAGLADYELTAGASFLWPTWADMRFIRSTTDMPAIIEAGTVRAVVVRWGDPRIEDILETWRQAKSVGWAEVRKDLPMHAARLLVVMTNWVSEFHLIPKSLGSGPSDDDDEAQDAREFNPGIYHHHHVEMLDWYKPDHAMQAELDAASRHRVPVYVEFERYFCSWHGSLPVDRQPRQMAQT